MPGNKLVVNLYRLVMKHIRALPPDGLEVIRSFDKEAWLTKRGLPRFFPGGTSKQVPSEATCFGLRHLTPGVLLGEVRRRFREGDESGANGADGADGVGRDDGVGRALEAIKALDEQAFLRERYSCLETNVARVCSIAAHVGDNRTLDSFYDADEDSLKHYFSYRITITNLSPTKTLRVVDRTWRIFNNEGDLSVEVKRSVGLVGMTPTLMPGSSFEYYSGTDLESRTGRMEGKFGCIVVGEEGDEETFDANVPALIFE